HNQGAKADDLTAAAFIPKGNAIPIKKPKGKRIVLATRMRRDVVELAKARNAGGVAIPKLNSTKISKNSGSSGTFLATTVRPIHWVKRLPRPLEISKTKSTTDSA